MSESASASLQPDPIGCISLLSGPGMPKEPRGGAQGCVGEREHISRPASKNAKDKSNSAAVLAFRAHTEQERNGRDSRCSEKDSGYSGEY